MLKFCWNIEAIYKRVSKEGLIYDIRSQCLKRTTDQIKQLLKELKTQGLIQLTGSTKASLWYPGI